MGGRLCSRPTTISLHKAVPGNACMRSTQITGWPLQSTDNNFSTQGGPWQCVRAFHTNNRVATVTTIPLQSAQSGLGERPEWIGRAPRVDWESAQSGLGERPEWIGRDKERETKRERQREKD